MEPSNENNKIEIELEKQKLIAENERLNNENSRLALLEKQKLNLEVEKIQVEIAKINRDKNRWNFTFLNFMQILPAFAIALITYVVAENNNLLENKKIHFSQNQFLLDSTNLLERMINERQLKEAIILKQTLIDETSDLVKSKDSLERNKKAIFDSIQYLNSKTHSLIANLSNVENDKKGLMDSIIAQENKLQRLATERSVMEVENKYAEWDYELRMAIAYPSMKTDFVSNIINYIRKGGLFSSRLMDTLVLYQKQNSYRAYFPLVLYLASGKKAWKDVFFQTVAENIDSLGNASFTNDYLTLLTTPRLTTSDRYKLTEIIINGVWEKNMSIKGKIGLMNSISDYSYDSLYNLAEYKYDLFYKYLKINYDLITKTTTLDNVEMLDPITNISNFCPQLTVSILAKHFFRIFSLQKEGEVVSTIQIRITTAFVNFLDRGAEGMPDLQYDKMFKIFDDPLFPKFDFKNADNERSYNLFKGIVEKTRLWSDSELLYLRTQQKQVLIKLKNVEY